MIRLPPVQCHESASADHRPASGCSRPAREVPVSELLGVRRVQGDIHGEAYRLEYLAALVGDHRR